MKKLVLVIVALLVTSTCAFATPVFTGDTYATWGEGGIPTLPTSTGYYIWSNDAARTSWSVRWTGNGNGTTDDELWYGSIDFISNDMTSYQSVLWESSGYYADGLISYTSTFSNEYLEFDGHAGPHFDGFDFTIDPAATAGRLRFNLGGSYYDNLDLNDSDLGVEAYGLWVGMGNVVNVNVGEFNNGSKFQSFEAPAPVPEPATLLLLGSGLVGLAFLKRRKS